MKINEEDSHELAARLSARTSRILLGSTAMFVVWQAAYFVVLTPSRADVRTVDAITRIAFIAWCGALLMLLATGGGAFRAREVRELLNDELARAQRAQAYQNAFWAMLLVSLAGYVAAHVTVIGPLLLAHTILSAGVLAAVATVAYLNRQ